MKKNNLTLNLNSLKNDLRKYANQVCKYAASEIADELTEDTVFAIGAFYSHYTPEKYKRHYYNFMNKSYRRYYSNPHNKIYRGGVEFTPNLMDKLYRDSIDEVFGSVIELGSHGPELYTNVQPMRRSPMQMVIEDRDNIEKNIDEYINRAKAKAKTGTYSVLSFK